MKRAWNIIRPEPHYRHDAFNRGLQAVGYEIQKSKPAVFQPGDLVVGWNRYSGNHAIANAVEAAGGIYLCAENGYVGMGGQSPHHMLTRDPYSLAIGYHNDSSVIHCGNSSRWDALGVAVQPWQNNEGGHILICPNRPFGAPGRAMPVEWAHDAAVRYRNLTGREIRVRTHPGNNRPMKPLADDLHDAYACVIWSSSAGVHALVAGIPIIAECPKWICKEAALSGADEIYPRLDLGFRRAEALNKLAHGQFFISEIESGFAFNHILNQPKESANGR